MPSLDTKPANGAIPPPPPSSAKPAPPSSPPQAPPLPPPQSPPKGSAAQRSVAASLASAPTPNEDAIQAHATRNAGEGAAPPDKKRGPYKPRAGSKPTSTLVQAHETVDAKRAAFRKVGHGIADALILGGRTLGGPIWEPVLIKDEKGIIIHDERTNLREAWADMAESYEWEKFPPWLGATIVTASYVGPRMFHEQTLSRIDKLKMWWAGRKAKKAEQTEKTKDGAGA